MRMLLFISFFVSFLIGCTESENFDGEVNVLNLELKSVSEPIYLRNLYPGVWDSVVLIEPYSNIDSLSKNTGIDLSSLSEYDISVRDDIKLLAFIKNLKVEAVQEIKRGVLDVELLEVDSNVIQRDAVVYPIKNRRAVLALSSD